MIDPKGVTAGGAEVIRILCNTGVDGHSVAVLRKQGQEHVGIRWNGEEGGKGYPTARGYPVWFFLPKELGVVLSAHYRAILIAGEEQRPASDYY